MQVARSLTIGRSTLARGSTSRIPIRSPNADRYLAIHAFFTRQASTINRPAPPSVRSILKRSRRFNSTSTSDPKTCQKCSNEPSHQSSQISITPGRDHAQDYVPFIRRLIRRTESIAQDAPHRPTKEELLAAASGMWERLRIRLKWFFIRGWRRFNTDDLSFFASWFVVGNSEH